MIDPKVIAEVSRFVEQTETVGKTTPTQVPGLFVVRQVAPSEFDWTVYNPNICLVLQGRKTAFLGARKAVYGPGEALIVSHAVPTISAVIEASSAEPYLALVLQLDLNTMRDLLLEYGSDLTSAIGGQTLEVEEIDEALLSCFVRLLRCSQDPLEAKAIGPLVLREAHFHILRARHAGGLRRLMDIESKASKISVAISEIQRKFLGQILVGEIAASTGMSISAFHRAFKEVTSLTPLQFQKDLRLIEARGLIRFSDKPVSQIAFEVGYESPSQFSREYSRKFGVAPSLDSESNG